jgi:hypothetical protein
LRLRYICVLLVIVLLSACQSSLPEAQTAQSPLPQPAITLSPLETPATAVGLSETEKQSLLAAVNQKITGQVTDYAGGIDELITLESKLLDERSAVWRGRLTPTSCDLIDYEITLDAVRDQEDWELFDSENDLANFGVAWATAWSGAHDGEPTVAPGTPNQLMITHEPAAMFDVLQSVLDEPENHLTRVTSAFYICMTEADGYGSLAGKGLARIETLIPEIRKAVVTLP